MDMDSMDDLIDNVGVNETPQVIDRLGQCEVCGSRDAKYTCPRCEVKTCCVECVNIHKKELECDGVRNKVLYKPLSKFHNLDLLSDYRLLEDVTRSVEKIKNSAFKRVPRFLPGHLHSLGRAARDRGMRLHYLPRNFKRAVENTSRVIFTNQTRLIEWRIEWLFPQAGVRCVSEKVPETFRLAEALSPLLDVENKLSKSDREQLQFFYAAGISGVCALMRVGEMERKRYHLLDMDTSIRGNLMRKSIIEFPTILIILKDHKYSYEIHDSDDEGEPWRRNWESSPAANSTKVPLKQKVNPANQNNFLFGGDDSSSDEGGNDF